MSRVVLDASALLAVLLEEPGAEHVGPHLTMAVMSAVNLSEVLATAVERGLMLESVQPVLDRLSMEIMPFDTDQAYLAASFRPATRTLGLSLGDRACLALGLKEGLPVLTADQPWAKLEGGVQVQLIR